MAIDPKERERAQAVLRSGQVAGTAGDPQDTLALVEELHTHQIELEIQNEELRASQQELQAARDSYARLYEWAPVAYLTLANDETILQANQTAAILFDQPRSELVGARLTKFIHHDDQDVWYLLRQQLRDQASRLNCELRVNTLQGVLIVQIATHSVPTPDGAGSTLLVSMTDVSEQRDAEQKLRVSEQRFQSLLASLNDVVWAASPEGTYLYLSPAVEQVYGLAHDSCLADRNFWLKSVLPEDLAIAERTHSQLFEQVHFEAEYRIRRPDGSVRWLWDRKYVVREGDNIIAVGGIATDITQRKRADAERAVAQAALADRLTVKTRSSKPNWPTSATIWSVRRSWQRSVPWRHRWPTSSMTSASSSRRSLTRKLVCSAVSTHSSRRECSNGFSMKSMAPSRINSTAEVISPWAEITMHPVACFILPEYGPPPRLRWHTGIPGISREFGIRV